LLLVVEEEPQTRRLLRTLLGSEGWSLLEAETGAVAESLLAGNPVDVILLDPVLPDVDGVALIRRLRGWMKAPILVLSTRSRETDKVEALDAGADDYVTKPFGPGELLARIRVALRHARDEVLDSPLLVNGALRIDLETRRVTYRGREIRLTPIEFRLLVFLARHAGKVLTHRMILNEVWGPGFGSQTHYLRVYMAHLRGKIEEDPARPRLLLTEQGIGYRLLEADG
jgi:two-component system KDP operon response regulator KdpE